MLNVYVGVLGVIFSFFWFFLVFNSPTTHPRISAEERDYIEKALNTSACEKVGIRKVDLENALLQSRRIL